MPRQNNVHSKIGNQTREIRGFFHFHILQYACVHFMLVFYLGVSTFTKILINRCNKIRLK